MKNCRGPTAETGLQPLAQVSYDNLKNEISSKIFGSYTKYRESEGDYANGTSLSEYKGDTPDNLKDYSVGIMVGLSLGDKLFSKTKSALGFK